MLISVPTSAPASEPHLPTYHRPIASDFMATTQQTYSDLLDAAVVAGVLSEAEALASDHVWALFTAEQQRDSLAIFARQRWGNASKGRELARYVASCADLLAND